MVVDGPRPRHLRGGRSLAAANCVSSNLLELFRLFGLYLTFATAASAIVKGATAVRHAGLPLDIGMLWLLVDLPS